MALDLSDGSLQPALELQAGYLFGESGQVARCGVVRVLLPLLVIEEQRIVPEQVLRAGRVGGGLLRFEDL
jgi:hypothetical protein